MKCSGSKNEGTTVLGNQKSYFGGKDITSNKLLARVVTFFLIVIPYCLFAGTGMVWFIHNNGYSVPITVTVIFMTSITLFFFACFSDPGIIPRQNPSNDTYDLFKGKSKNYKIPQEIHMMIDGKFLAIKYCITCNMYRSPRSVHCRTCNVCVKRFDHHCKWLGNCVGHNNYRLFIAFIAATFLMIIAVVSFSIVRAVYIKKDASIVKGTVETVVTLTYIVLSGWFIAGLFVYHSYLIFTNQTTNEHLKSLFREFNPWNRGKLNNIKEVLFRKRKKKHFYMPSLKPKTLYNPVSQVRDPLHFGLVKKHLVNFGDALDHTNPNSKQQNLSFQSSNSWDPKPLTDNDFLIKQNPSTEMTNIDGNYQSDMYASLNKQISLSSFNSTELSISNLMDTYTKLKNNLNDTTHLNKIALDKINNTNLVVNNNIPNGYQIEISNEIKIEFSNEIPNGLPNQHSNTNKTNELKSNTKKNSKLIRKDGIDLSCKN